MIFQEAQRIFVEVLRVLQEMRGPLKHVCFLGGFSLAVVCNPKIPALVYFGHENGVSTGLQFVKRTPVEIPSFL